MSPGQTADPTRTKPLRLWPGVLAVVAQWSLWMILPLLDSGITAGMISALGALACGLLVFVWWAFFSRAPHPERWGALALMAGALFVSSRFLHESVAGGGMGFLYWGYAIPVLCLAFVLWAVASRRFSQPARRWTMVATILLACGVWTVLRTEGVLGSGSLWAWRWSESLEERFLAQAGDEPTSARPPTWAVDLPAAWPGFRGPGRDGVVRGLRIETDWSATPPVELWRRPVGPGWSSLAVHGGLVFTQEQHGDDEAVTCYDASTGELVWRHRDPVRFWESNAGPGPRGTPEVSGGRVYAFGATGILNALEAADGAVAWSRDVASDAGAEVPTWGFSSSPLVVDDVVLVAAAGRLAGYERATGEPRWLGPAGGPGYSSPHLVSIGGVPQVLLLSGAGATSLSPADGTVLWQHDWRGFPIVQPARTVDGDLLLTADGQSGIRRIAVARGPGGWSLEERWTSNRLKPYFNDFVVHRGHAYGFDGTILAAIDLEDGGREWKGGRYGQGQLVLLPDQDLLLVVSGTGELALVSATPDRYTELASFQALTGKTWNHPVVVGDLLLVRNGQEMAAFRLPVARG